jgi:hypothetical protein
MMDYSIRKYPRTPHLEGSRLQAGDEGISRIPFCEIAGEPIVVEEKCDGANCGVSFDGDGTLLLQSRGHYLTGGYSERHYALFKQWANVHRDAFYRVLGARYILYGEWLYAKHTVYYNDLSHYFLEFDVFDRTTGQFLDTASRRALLSPLPVRSAPVLTQGTFSTLPELKGFLGPSRYIREPHLNSLRQYCSEAGLDAEKYCAETDASPLMEGLYIKVEADGVVCRRMKFVRASYLQGIAEDDTAWLQRTIVPNQLCCPVEALFAPQLPHDDRENADA